MFYFWQASVFETSQRQHVVGHQRVLRQLAGTRSESAEQFCGPGRELCMDSMHGMNSYDFQLTTILAIDEHGEGFPVAFAYSSHVDETSMAVFLAVIKESLGTALHDVVFMSDDREVYINAWTAVMGPPAHRLLCAWHIDRAWRRNLTRIIINNNNNNNKGDRELKAVVYKMLRELMEITSPEEFSSKLAEFLSAAEEDSKTADFGQYFRKEYGQRPELWAYCYRVGLRVHHNMH